MRRATSMEAWYLHGRSDDTIKIAGKRIGPSEIEMALMASGLLADAAIVAVPDAITGSALACACVPIAPIDDPAKLVHHLASAVADSFGASYRPKQFIFVSELPRTRNQKLMRRVVRGVLTGAPLGDLSSLANPESIESLRSEIVFASEDRSEPASRPAPIPSYAPHPCCSQRVDFRQMAKINKDPKYKDILFEV